MAAYQNDTSPHVFTVVSVVRERTATRACVRYLQELMVSRCKDCGSIRRWVRCRGLSPDRYIAYTSGREQALSPAFS